MEQYLNIDDKNFYENVNEKFKKYKIPEKKRSFKEICFPKKYELQPSQKFLAKFINPNTNYKSILVYHKIGSGKTCTAIRIAETWRNIRKIIIVLPASLKNNFRSELRSSCAGENYLKENERRKLKKYHQSSIEYKEIIEISDKRIDKYYTIYSYNKFIKQAKDNLINFNNSIIIIDEIQNMVSVKGTYYSTLYQALYAAPEDLRIVLLSATPMFDRPNEIALTLNLLRPTVKIPTGTDFNSNFVRIIKDEKGNHKYKAKNLNEFKKLIKGYVSYFKGAPDYVFPEMDIKYVKCKMSEFQYDAYKEVKKHNNEIMLGGERDFQLEREKSLNLLTIDDLPSNFYLGLRIISNIVFPNKKINFQGFESFKGKYIMEDLSKYSTKFFHIMNNFESTDGKIFVYSSFKKYGGIKSFTRVLDSYGYKNYLDHGEGKKRYAIWSGDQDAITKEEIRLVYNNIKNLDASKLQILLLSPSAKEGLSLFGVRQAHILENYWNWSRMLQIIGRGSRYCSHKDLPEEKRNIKVYVYLAIHPDEKESVDEHIFNLAKKKNNLINYFEEAIKEAAVDCELFKNANIDKGEMLDCVV
jgi:superfamily II DNA or RNA helicase